jgi:hypothetical protein
MEVQIAQQPSVNRLGEKEKLLVYIKTNNNSDFLHPLETINKNKLHNSPLLIGYR